jgi:hypothetical protein
MAGFARLAGSSTSTAPSDTVTVSRTISLSIGGEQIGDYHIFEHRAVLPTGHWLERCNLEYGLRTAFPVKEGAWAAQSMHLVEPVHVKCLAYDDSSPWQGPTAMDLACCRPESLHYVYVIGAACGVTRENAARLLRPLSLMTLGERVGLEAHQSASSRIPDSILTVSVGRQSGDTLDGDTHEALEGHRPFHSYHSLHQPENHLPVWGSYDVVVVGGGTSGVPAALGAARKGARVLVIEMLGSLGGARTNGTGRFWYGYPTTFTEQFPDRQMSVTLAQQFFDSLAFHDVDIWFNTLACGVVKDQDRVSGVLVATPQGRAAVSAGFVVDATGDGDICAWAGANYTLVNEGDFGLQEASYLGAPRESDTSRLETESVHADPADIAGFSRFHVLSRRYGAFRNQFDFFPLAGMREHRLIVGESRVAALDQYIQRRYADGIAVVSSDYDCHGFFTSTSSYAGLFPTLERKNTTPLSSMIPKGLTGILVTGRAKSVTHDALCQSRMQPDLVAAGYAAGHIAAVCAQSATAVRSIDTTLVRQELQEVNNQFGGYFLLGSRLFMDEPEPTEADLAAAAHNPSVPDNMATLLRTPASIPHLRTSFTTEQTVDKAVALCLLGDTTGVGLLSECLDTTEFSGGASYLQLRDTVPEADRIIWALGQSGDERAVPILARMLDSCDYTGWVDTTFSHIRALTMALRTIGSSIAIPALRRFLDREEVMGNVKYGSEHDASSIEALTNSLVELHAAAGLYACGDDSGRGRNVLETYLDDWRGGLVRGAANALGLDSQSIAPTRYLAMNPPDLDFGTIEGTKMRDVTFINSGNAPVCISAITCGSPSYECSMPLPLTVPPFDSVTISIQLTRTGDEDLDATVIIESDAHNDPTLDVPVAAIASSVPVPATSGAAVTMAITMIALLGAAGLGRYRARELSRRSRPCTVFKRDSSETEGY